MSTNTKTPVQFCARLKTATEWPSAQWAVCFEDTQEVLAITGPATDAKSSANARALCAVLNRVQSAALKSARRHE